ncbi:MAG: response regulator [Planctomycetaceae bacterium]|nr:response regulator [Planctomycetaceae bacterium]
MTQHPKVLIVEDDPGHQKLLELYLRRMGCDCDCCFDGKTGLKMACRNSYDILFIDIHIPEMDGFMLATQLRDRSYKAPLVAVTALKMEGIRRNALKVGYNDFLEKPIDQDDLANIVHHYVPALDTSST